jgi:hypothetical protein
MRFEELANAIDDLNPKTDRRAYCLDRVRQIGESQVLQSLGLHIAVNNMNFKY